MEKQKMNIATLVIVIAIVLIMGVIAGVLIGKNMSQVQTSKKGEEEKIQQENKVIKNETTQTNLQDSTGYASSKQEEKLIVPSSNVNSTINQASNTDNDKNTCEKLKGTYKYLSKTNEGRFECAFTLDLADDGTFDYVTTIQNAAGFCGNYSINDSELILNKIFLYGSDVGIILAKGQVKLKINQDRTIQDTNKYHEYGKNGESIANFTLKKETDKFSYGLREHIINAVKYNAISAKS